MSSSLPSSLAGRYSLFVFDLDGTLIDSRADIANAANRTLGQFGYAPLSSDAIVGLVGSGVRQLIRDLFKQSAGHEVNAPILEQAYRFFMTDYGDHCTSETRFYPDVIDCIARLGHRPLAILSNKPELLSIKILTALGYPKRFYPVIGGDSLPTKKPSPEGLLSIMTVLGIAPERTLMLGDSTIDVETARNARCDSLVTLSGFAKKSDLANSGATYIVDDFKQLLQKL